VTRNLTIQRQDLEATLHREKLRYQQRITQLEGSLQEAQSLAKHETSRRQEEVEKRVKMEQRLLELERQLAVQNAKDSVGEHLRVSFKQCYG
jgi:hypothetical protein